MTYKIVHEPEKCIACGACWMQAPEFWEQGSDGKSKLKKGKKVEDKYEREIEEKDVAENKEVAENCPVNIIHVVKQ